ncbi:MAG: helix-turn-helix domain-containing protein [Patescibacteria group bacterium]|jgi:sugar-specific transcriptional regulator TrmB
MDNLQINGLSQKEFEAYKNLLSLKRSTVLQLAKISNDKRTNLYRLLETLIGKGLVSEIYEGSKHYYIAESPSRLVNFVAQEKKKIEELLPELEQIEKEAMERPKIKYFEGKEGIKNLEDELLKERKEILAFSWPDKLVQSIESHDSFVKKRIKAKIPARVIYPDTGAAHKRKTGFREVRYSKKLKPFDSTFMISGNKVVAFSHKRWITGVLIENREIAEGLTAFFDAYWSELKETKK